MTVYIVIFALCAGALALTIYNMLVWPRVASFGSRPSASVSILIPARNEERNIVPCIESALAGSAAVTEVAVYDDHSTDATAARVLELAAGDRRVLLLPPQPIPAGWYGKPFACSQLAARAAGHWLLFIDADTRLKPGAADRIAAEAERRDASFLSCWPGLDLGGFWEAIFMPMLNFVVFTLFPAPLSFKMNMPSLGLAHGACIIARKADYDRIGGHALVKNEVFEDTLLARAWRAAGLRSLCLDGQEVIRVRMYASLPEIWRGFKKIAYPAFRREFTFWSFLAFHAAAFVSPFVVAAADAAGGSVSSLAWGAAIATLAIRAIQARRFNYPLWSVLFHPIAECALIALSLASWWRCRIGGGVEWKGRTYRGNA